MLFNLRTLLIRWCVTLALKLGGYLTLEPFIYWRSTKIRICDIERYNYITRESQGRNQYRWERLKNSIENNGLRNNLEILYGVPIKAKDRKRIFILLDGNHRLAVLRELYGDDYEVEVNLFLPDPYDRYHRFGIKSNYMNNMYTKNNAYGGRVNTFVRFKELWLHQFKSK
tara:strand:+ start:17 stop:526 length:510 start_codon:yes stop_codon:yes gene_type:complete